MKTKLLLIIVIIFSIWSTFADDCHLFNQGDPFHDKYKNQLAPLNIGKTEQENKILNVLPKSALELALQNLHASCCASRRSSATICNKPSNQKNRKERKNFPESNYLFDHLLDVQLRRWSYNKAYQGLPIDDQAQKRNENIETNILETWGKLPTVFNREYAKYRELQKELLLPNYEKGMNPTTYKNLLEDILEGEKSTHPINQKKIEKFNERNLRTKFLNSCAVATYTTILLSTAQDLSSTLFSAQESCLQLLDQQLQNQHNQLQQAIEFKSDKLIQDTLKEYGSLYFGQKLTNLQSRVVEISTYLQGVMRQVTKLVPKCN